MRSKILFLVAIAGVVLGLGAAWYFSAKHPPQPPVFTPAANPYSDGIFATGIIESRQESGQNIALFPDVSGTVLEIPVREGATVGKGAPILVIDQSVQRQVVAQQRAQADAARAALAQLKAQPRPEALAVARSQMESAAATLRGLRDQLAKQRRSAEIDERSVSRDVLDTAENAVRVGEANLEVARRQYELTKAGAWSLDIQTQAQALAALERQYQAGEALLEKYTLRAPIAGVVLAINAAVGGYVAPSGAYQSYTGGAAPVVVMSSGQGILGVRVYVDEILVHRLPTPERIIARMQIRGTDVKIPLRFSRIQPYVTPKIELSDQRQERVDLRVLPIIFDFPQQAGITLYPGQLVDVYVGTGGAQ